MDDLRDLLEEYDRLGDARFSTAHDFMLRQRHLENWADKARRAIAELVQQDAATRSANPEAGDQRPSSAT